MKNVNYTEHYEFSNSVHCEGGSKTHNVSSLESALYYIPVRGGTYIPSLMKCASKFF